MIESDEEDSAPPKRLGKTVPKPDVVSREVSASVDEGEEEEAEEEAEAPTHIPNGPGGRRDHRTVNGRTYFIEDDECVCSLLRMTAN